eukprot:9503381-Pyramimonas_sp.AAC.2
MGNCRKHMIRKHCHGRQTLTSETLYMMGLRGSVRDHSILKPRLFQWRRELTIPTAQRASEFVQVLERHAVLAHVQTEAVDRVLARPARRHEAMHPVPDGRTDGAEYTPQRTVEHDAIGREVQAERLFQGREAPPKARPNGAPTPGANRSHTQQQRRRAQPD